MNFKYLLLTGHVPAIHPAAMFLVYCLPSHEPAARRRPFAHGCAPWVHSRNTCGSWAEECSGVILRIPRWADIPLRGLKYLLLGFFLFAIGAMSAEALQGFMDTPYGLVADVKMLNFFRNMGHDRRPSLLLCSVSGLMLVQNFWCRYLCPYGALMGLVSLLSPVKIRRDTEACIDCGKCARACPAGLQVDQPGADSFSRMQRLHGLRRSLPSARCPSVLPAAETGRGA